MATKVKICGIKTPEALASARDAGASLAGFVFFEKSPRNVDIDTAAQLVKSTTLSPIGLFVDPTDDFLNRVLNKVPLKMLQLHGNETPARVAAIKSMTDMPVMKAIRIATPADLSTVSAYAPIVNWLLFDAKVEGSALPGGTGRNFDWTILEGFRSPKPWMLAGGLTPENVGDALKKLKPDAVDVSSGVESAPGVKDASKIAAFVASVRSA